jgi:hypothetical protein
MLRRDTPRATRSPISRVRSVTLPQVPIPAKTIASTANDSNRRSRRHPDDGYTIYLGTIDVDNERQDFRSRTADRWITRIERAGHCMERALKRFIRKM